MSGETQSGERPSTQTDRKFFISRYQRNGGSYCIIIPPAVRDALCLAPHDLVLMRVVEDFVVFRRFDAARILSRQEARQFVTNIQRCEAEAAANG
jgi:antitoxin component of MazEF toxin-antitoxin module